MKKVLGKIGLLVAIIAITGCTKRVIEEDCCTSEYAITTQNYELPPDFNLYIPQAFTPNGDGINDQFRPLGNGWKVENMVIKKGITTVYESSEHLDAFWSGSTAKQDGKYKYKITFRAVGSNDLFEVEGEVCVFRYGAKGEEIPEIEREKVCECVMPDMIHPQQGIIYETAECPVKKFEEEEEEVEEEETEEEED